MSETVCIEVWSDYVCPFCYLEMPELERLVVENPGRVSVQWRAFELRPAPVPTLDPRGDYLKTTWAWAVYPMAAERGLTLRLPSDQRRSRLHRGLFRAFFEEDRDIGSLDVLLDVSEAAGLGRVDMEDALRSGRWTESVLADERLAQEIGVSGVPALVMHRASEPIEAGVLVSGAQPYGLLARALEQVVGGG